MKKSLSSGIVALALVLNGSALAADVGARPQPSVAPAATPTWTGCYVGANGGWVRSNSDFSWTLNTTGFPVNGGIVSGLGSNTITTDGGTAGGQIGCNTQANNFVVGFETDVQWTGIDKTLSGAFAGCAACGIGGGAVSAITFTEHLKSNWNSTSRIRIGWAAGDFLLYGTGGFGVAHVTFDDTVAFFAGPGGTLSSMNVATDTRNKFGWVAGAGAEWMFAPRWSVKLEYLHLDFGNLATSSVNVTTAGAVTTAAVISHNHNLTEDMVRVGVNYQFGSLFW